MTTVYFSNGELQYKDPKTARAKLRGMGLTVRDARKINDDYHFDCSKPDGVSQYKVQVTKPIAESALQMVMDSVNEPVPVPLVPKGEQVVVKGRDLKAGDTIIDFIPRVNLTVDHRGVTEIVIPASDLTRVENNYTGFYSVQSYGISSYLIDPSREYLVDR